MTDTNQTPEPTPAEAQTAPMPTTPQAESAAYAAPPAYATAPMPEAAPPVHHHGVHVAHRVSEGAIVVMVVGALLFGLLSFGIGWAARGAAARFESQRAGMMGQGYGQGQNGLPFGHPNVGGGRRGMMRGQGNGGYGNGQGYGQGGQGYGQGYGQDGQGWGQGNPGTSAPATGTPY